MLIILIRIFSFLCNKTIRTVS